uniref:Hydroxysteroid 11-beta-dehydrogenase 1-like protein n=1 Tax=Astyanax mexicanus TaxID=7994 RepID=A0A8B9HLR1_ASTMX
MLAILLCKKCYLMKKYDSYTSFITCFFYPESLKGAKVLVTGASTGIGEQIAYHYARLGAQIVITARRENVLKEVVKKCEDLGAQKALYIAADMANPTDVDRVVEFAEKKLGGLDYLVLNHIGPSPYRMWDGDMDHIRWLMQVNFYSYLQMTVKALPALEKSKGSVVVVSSMLGKMCSPYALPYIATKFALNGFFGSLEHELVMKQSNVSISICILGLIDTEAAIEKVKLPTVRPNISVGVACGLTLASGDKQCVSLSSACNLRGYIDMAPYPAHEAAWNIIKTGALRQSESTYPSYVYYGMLFRDWFPTHRDMVIRGIYNYKP